MRRSRSSERASRCTDSIVDLQTLNQRLNAENQVLADRFSKLTEYNQVLGDDLANLDAEILYLEQLIETKTQKMDHIAGKVEALNKSISACRRTLEGDEAVSRMARKLKKMEEMRISALKRLRELRGDTFVDNLEEVKTNLNMEIEALEWQKQDLEEQLEVLEVLVDREASSAERKDVLEEVMRQKGEEKQELLGWIARVREEKVMVVEDNDGESEFHERERQRLLAKDPESYNEMKRYMEESEGRPRSHARHRREESASRSERSRTESEGRPKSYRRHRKEDEERSAKSPSSESQKGRHSHSRGSHRRSSSVKRSRPSSMIAEYSSKDKKASTLGRESPKKDRKSSSMTEEESPKRDRKSSSAAEEKSPKRDRKSSAVAEESPKRHRKSSAVVEESPKRHRKSSAVAEESPKRDRKSSAVNEASVEGTEVKDAENKQEQPEEPKPEEVVKREGVADAETQANEDEIDPVVNIKAFEFTEQEKEALAKLESLQAEILIKEEEKKNLEAQVKPSNPNWGLSRKFAMNIAPTPDAVKDLSLTVIERRSKGIVTEVTGESLDFHMQLLDDQVAELTVASDLQDNVEMLRKQIRATNEKIEDAKELAEEKDEQIKRIKDDLRAAKISLEQEQTNEDLETRMRNHVISEISQMKSSIMMMADQMVEQNARTEAAEAKLKELVRVKHALERDIRDMAQREKPEVRSLTQEVSTCQARVKEAQQNLEKSEAEIKAKRAALEELKTSKEMQEYRDLTIRRVKLERRVNKWKILLKDSKETIQSLEVFSATNSQKRQTLTETLEKALRSKRANEEEIRELEHYSALLAALLREQTENWS